MTGEYTLKTWLFGFYNGIDYDDPGDSLYKRGHPTEAPIVPAQPTGAWSIGAMADINRDGQVDLIWKYDPTGQMAYWIMKGNQFVTAGDIRDAYMNLVICSSGWKPVGSGDFDGDGVPDILFQHTDGSLAVWYMDWYSGRYVYRYPSLLNPSNSGHWRAVGTGDVNRDGKVDILLQYDYDPLYPNIFSSVGVWYMNGAGSLSGSDLLNPGMPSNPYMRVAATADFNRDNFVDLLFQTKATQGGTDWGGNLTVWHMNGIKRLGNEKSLPAPDIYHPVGSFNVVGPR